MGSLYIRNYLVVAVVGVFCLLNVNIVSAQTATNLNCAGCVGPRDIGGNAVRWGKLHQSIRQGIVTREDQIAALTDDVAALTAAAADLQMNPVVLDGNGVEIGLLVNGHDWRTSIHGVSIITQQSYVLIGLSLGSGTTTVSVPDLVFASENCTGPAFSVTPAGFVQSAYDLTGVPNLFYAAKNSLATADFVLNSRTGASGCSGSAGGTEVFAWRALPNDPVVTGISSQTYQLPIEIVRPNN